MTQGFQQFDWLAWGLHATWNDVCAQRGTQNEQIYKDELAKQPRFTEEGHPNLTLLYVGMEEDRWEEGKTALCLYLFDKQTGRGDFYQMSLSDSYIQDRNNTGVRKTGYQNTVEKLAKLGFQGGDDFERFASEFFGKDIPCWVASKTAKNSGNLYYYIAAIGASGQAKAVMPWNIVRPAAPSAPAPQPQTLVCQPSQAQAYQQPAPQPQPQTAYQPPVQAQAAPPMPQGGIPANNPFGN